MFPLLASRVWLPDRLTLIQEAARALWGVTLPKPFYLDAPFAPPGFRQPNPSEKHRDHRREIAKVFFNSQLSNWRTSSGSSCWFRESESQTSDNWGLTVGGWVVRA
jgi:hypothetical protein